MGLVKEGGKACCQWAYSNYSTRKLCNVRPLSFLLSQDAEKPAHFSLSTS